MQRFQAQVVAGRGHERGMAQAGNLRHLPQSHVGAQSHDTRQKFVWLRVVFDIAVQNMGERAQKLRLLRHKPQQIGNPDTRQSVVEGAIDRFLFVRIEQRPAALRRAGDLDMFVFTVRNAFVDRLVLGFEGILESPQRFLR